MCPSCVCRGRLWEEKDLVPLQLQLTTVKRSVSVRGLRPLISPNSNPLDHPVRWCLPLTLLVRTVRPAHGRRRWSAWLQELCALHSALLCSSKASHPDPCPPSESWSPKLRSCLSASPSSSESKSELLPLHSPHYQVMQGLRYAVGGPG